MANSRELDDTRSYWSFRANPAIYRVEDDLRSGNTVVYWTTKRSKVKAGDRAIIWKSKGKDSYHGIVALAEVLSDPLPSQDTNNPFWNDPSDGLKIENRVKVWQHPLPDPLWAGGPYTVLLEELNVYKSQRGTVNHVTHEQWSAIMDAVGGWTEISPEVSAAEAAIADVGRPLASAARYRADTEARTAIEADLGDLDESQLATRIRLVEEHLRCENLHDLDGVMGTFGETPCYDNEPMEERHVGQAAVRAFYLELFRAIPNLLIDVENRYVTDEAIILEVWIRGTHLGPWRGLPATGRSITYPLCGIFTFDERGRLAQERIYYDRATIYRQLGVFHEPFTPRGRILTAVTHPLTIARAWWRSQRN